LERNVDPNGCKRALAQFLPDVTQSGVEKYDGFLRVAGLRAVHIWGKRYKGLKHSRARFDPLGSKLRSKMILEQQLIRSI
jgi:hypothetical protein